MVTEPGERGRGHAAALEAAACEWTLAERAEVGLFTCDRETAPVYLRGGWAALPDAVLVGGTPADPFPSDAPGTDKVVLTSWPDGDEAAVLAAFAGARVLLDPGEIDVL